MKKIIFVLACVILVAQSSWATPLEDSVESCRIVSTGLLPDEPQGKVYSSRVLIQEMKLRFLQNNQEKFDVLFRLLKKHFQSRLMLLYRELDAYLDPIVFENSVITDIQACQLLLDASEKWNVTEYATWATKTAGRIRKFNVYREILVDKASWVEHKSGIFNINEVSHVFLLKSVDVKALQMLQIRFPEWEVVAQRSLGILLAGSSRREMFREYNIDRRRYEENHENSNDGLWIAYHLSEGGLLSIEVINWLKEKLEKDPSYFVEEERASIQSLSLIVYILRSAGELKLANNLKSLVEKEFISESGLLCEKGKKASIFDNLLWLSLCDYYNDN